MNFKEITSHLHHKDSFLPLLGIEDYKRTAVLIPLIKLQDEWHILFEERAAHIAQGGEVCFPGGRMEARDNNNGAMTAIRETREELCLEEEEISILGALGREPGMRGLIVDVYVGRIHKNSLQEIRYNEEVTRIFTYPIQYFLDNPPRLYHVATQVSHTMKDKQGVEQVLLPVKELNIPLKYHKPWGQRLHEIQVYDTPEGIIWGLTARILKYYLQSIK